MNEKPFNHMGRFGTFAECERCDLTKPMIVKKPKDISEENFLSDISEVVAWHAIHILPKLKSFSGYDTIKYKIVEE